MKNCPSFRNIGIIAHIDHGKTTLLDALMRQSNLFRDNEEIPERIMDSYDQEKERGITIFAKHTSIPYKDAIFNFIDTPGHSDFSGEVERVLGMVGSVLLLVDAQDGPMPQTRFVLSKALKMGIKPIVVINKVDRPHADPDRVLNETFDLFVELGASDEQLDFAHCYTSAIHGYAMRELDDPRDDMTPLFDLILSDVAPPEQNIEAPFLMQAMTIDYDPYVGRQATGRILGGKIAKGNKVIWVDSEGKETLSTVTRIEGYRGIKKIEFPEAFAGDIVSLSGIPDVMLGDTLCDPSQIERLPPIAIDEPTLSIQIMINSGPFSGQDGKNVTYNKIKERLFKEKRSNISLRIEESFGDQEAMTVFGRGELQLSVLLEAMRREGLEMTVSQPQVVVREIDGEKCEPIERVYIETPEEFSGAVIEELSKRKGEMQSIRTDDLNIRHVEFLIPTRGIIGYRSEFLSVTRGLGILTSLFDSFKPWKGEIPSRTRGSLISMNQGRATAYSLGTIQKRGTLFVTEGDIVYRGMIVGEHSRDNDLVVNVTKGKQLTNVRASGTDENIVLAPPKKLTLEQAIEWIEDDELIEITPHFLRCRKKYLTELERKRASSKK
ncbi:MAG: GTP-binding protein TypA/BipA [Chlamydiae bacterium]|nr:GTP-binding protein TypA/BipA [Chlamydiota bacterium]